jgi:2-dehydro-3-deoxyglucarate aldolase/4-hydroxy-2-oxoheptanedioate aldolase
MKNLEKMKKNIAEGKLAFGVFVTIADSCISEIVGYAGYDFVWIDAEHAAIDRREIYHHILAAQSAGAAAFVRVPGVDPTLVKAVMDMGPDGIIFPFIENKEIAELAVKACSYPPRGIRGQGPIRAIRYGIDDEGDYIAKADSAFWTILQIENVEGYNHLDEIMSVEGFDSIFIGPGDLSRSIDLPKEEKEIRMQEIQNDMCKRLLEKNIIIGTATSSYVPDITKCAVRGAHWINIAQDVRVISNSLQSTLKTIRESLK